MEKFFVIVLSGLVAVGLIIISFIAATPITCRREKLRKQIDNPPMPEPMYDGYVEEIPKETLQKIINAMINSKPQRVFYIKTKKE